MKDEERIDGEIRRLRKRQKDLEDLKIWGRVLDVPTLKTLYHLANKKVILAMGGAISTGKEAHIFHALGSRGEVAVKIYRIATSDFKAMQDYLIGDPRFKGIKKSKKDVVIAWARKELRNLERAREAGVKVPAPIAVKRNVLVMEFIGKDGVKAPLLQEIAREIDAQEAFDAVVDNMKLLYDKAKLVHADLSEYNIMYYDGPVFIDMGQAVSREHPNAETFFLRDVKNVVRFFKKLGVGCSEEGVIARIKGDQR
ncbi:MAG: serine protein kinase RIO [Methanocellales archaeon]|nr:serine protein kinase RIO [Methanocellales archaeon]